MYSIILYPVVPLNRTKNPKLMSSPHGEEMEQKFQLPLM